MPAPKKPNPTAKETKGRLLSIQIIVRQLLTMIEDSERINEDAEFQNRVADLGKAVKEIQIEKPKSWRDSKKTLSFKIPRQKS